MLIASSGVTVAVITVAAGAIVGAAASKPAQPIPVRVRIKRGLRGIRRR